MGKLLAVDGNSIINRAFYGIRALNAPDGTPTNAVYGMLNILLRHFEQIKPDCVAVAFDVHQPTFRHKEYEEYKAGRHETPPDLLAQFPIAKECLTALGFHVLECPGYEADDILGTLARMGEEQGHQTYILTGDRDSLQLISDTTNVLLATTGETKNFDRTAFGQKYEGTTPEQFVDLKALMGDSSDNIPGVPGIGEKTALKLICQFASLDGLYENYEGSSLSAGVKNKLSQGRDSAYLSQFLARIDKNAPIGVTLDDISYTGATDDLIPILTRLGFTALVKKFGNEKKTSYDNCEENEDVIELSDVTSLKKGEYGLHIDEKIYLYSEKPICFESNEKNLRALITRDDISLNLFDYKAFLHYLDGVSDGLGLELECEIFDCGLFCYVLNAGANVGDVDAMAISFLERRAPTPALCACVLKDLREVLYQRADGDEKHIYCDIELPLARVLYKMEREGFKVDIEALADFQTRTEEHLAVLEGEIYSLAGEQFNINSPKQLSSILFDEDKLNLPVIKKTKSGYSTNAEVLEKLAPYHPIIDKILDYRQLAKLNSTYAVGLQAAADERGIVHTTFNQTQTATGRLSSSEPNLQNIPIRTELGREMRKFFVADKGYKLIDADYSQIELRLFAAISGDRTMIEGFAEGADIHTLTASQIFGIMPGLVTPELRKRAKAVNFGILYGMGRYTLSQDLKISVKEADRYINGYLATYPEVDAYLKNTVARAHKDGFVTTLFGRKRYIPELSSQKKTLVAFGERVAMNSPIQGTAADIIKIAMVNTDKALEKAGIDARLILQVHDELIVRASEKDAEKAAQILKHEMENAFISEVRLEVELGIADDWYGAH